MTKQQVNTNLQVHYPYWVMKLILEVTVPPICMNTKEEF